MGESARTTREKAAAARAEALRAERSRQRRINLLIGGGLLVVIGFIVGGVILASNQNAAGSGLTLPAVDPGAPLPKTVLPATAAEPYGVPVGAAAATTSTVQIWEDFQCPVCARFEAAQGAAIQQLAADGKIFLVHRPATFLDKNLPRSDLSSARAVSAWGCAIDAGAGEKYHGVVFANQPAKEGDGYSDGQLLGFGTDAGLTGTAYDTFATCVTAHTYLGWAANSSGAFADSGIPGTPTVILDGTEIPSAELGNAAAYIDQNRKK